MSDPTYTKTQIGAALYLFLDKIELVAGASIRRTTHPENKKPMKLCAGTLIEKSDWIDFVIENINSEKQAY